MRQEYILHEHSSGVLTPVAVIYRRKELSQTEPCPFCGCSHAHGIGDGLRVPRCILIHVRGVPTPPKDRIMASDGTILLKENGYYLKTDPTIESIFDTTKT